MKKYLSGLDHLTYKGSEHIPSHPFICGYCKNTVAPDIGFRIYVTDSHSMQNDKAYIYKCPSCNNPSFYFIKDNETIPGSSFGREVKGLPENIQTLYNECRVCYTNQCYTSSQMIARTLLMHIAVEQGADEDKSFKYYVDYLSDNNYIPPNGKQWVDFIRQSGNVANHQIVIKEKEETEKVITFLSSLLLFIYELPAEMSQGGTP